MKPVVLFLVIFLVACGGGGGGGGGSQQGASFTVEYSQPTAQETNVERDIVLEARFTSPVAQSTINNTTILLENSRMTAIDSSLSINTDNTLVSLTPDNELAIYSDYQLLLSTTIEDEQSNALGSDIIVPFQTRDGLWRSPVTLDTTTNEQLYHQLARNSQGNKLAVWTEYGNPDVILKASYYDLVGGWSTAETISGVSLSATQASAAVNDSGNAIVLFRHLSSSQLTSASVWAAHYSTSSGWIAPKPIIESVVKDSPHVVMFENGDALALFRIYNDSETRWDVASSYYNATTGWSAIDTITRGPMSAYNLQLVTNHAGRTLAMWEQNNIIWVSRFENGAWGNTRIMASGSVGEGQLTINSQGLAIASWVDWQASEFYTSQFSGSQWSTAALAPLQPSPDYNYSMAANDDHAYLVWSNSGQLWAARFSNFTSWEQLQQVGNNSGAEDSNYRVRVDDSGNALLVWEEELPNDIYNVWSRRYQFDNGWQTPVRLDANANDAERPMLVMDPASGEATALWTEQDAGQAQTIVREFD